MAVRIQIRRGTAAQWTAANPNLAAGEVGYETDTGRLKVGNGTDAWTALEYYDDRVAHAVVTSGAVAAAIADDQTVIDAAAAAVENDPDLGVLKAPGADGDVLTVVSGVPDWAPPQGGAASMPFIMAADYDDGIRTDQQIVAAALAAALPGDHVFLEPRTYVGDGATITAVPEDVTLVGNRTTLESLILSPRSRSKITHIAFTNTTARSTIAIRSEATVWIDSPTIEHCYFYRVDWGIYCEYTMDGVTPERSHTSWNIRENVFSECSIPIVGFMPRSWRVVGNTIRGSIDRNIIFYSGERNKIQDNDIDGGVVGISFLSFRSIVSSLAIIEGNVITGNTIRGYSEEGISLDCHGNIGANVNVVEVDTVASVTSAAGGTQNHVALGAAGWSAATSPFLYYRHWVTFLDGALAGQSFRIQAQDTGTFIFFTDPTVDGHMTDAERASITVGDTVAIGSPSLRNVIAGNHVDAADSTSTGHGTKSGIILWGHAFLNTIANNTVKGGNIEIYNIEGMARPTPSYADNYGIGASIHNTVSSNTIEHGNLLWGFVDYHDGTGYPDGSGTPAIAYSGNVSRGNIIVGGEEIIQHQSVDTDQGGVGGGAVDVEVLFDPATQVYDYDDFVSGSTTNGTVGKWGWIVTATTVDGAVSGEADHPGVIKLTPSSGGAYGYIRSAQSGTGPIHSSSMFDVTWRVKPLEVLSTTTARVGLGADSGQNPPASGIYFEKVTTDTNWFAVTRSGGTQTRTDTGVAYTAAWTKLEFYRKDASTIGFRVNGGTEITHTANIPSVALTSFAASKGEVSLMHSIYIDRIDLRVTGLNR